MSFEVRTSTNLFSKKHVLCANHGFAKQRLSSLCLYDKRKYCELCCLFWSVGRVQFSQRQSVYMTHASTICQNKGRKLPRRTKRHMRSLPGQKISASNLGYPWHQAMWNWFFVKPFVYPSNQLLSLEMFMMNFPLCKKTWRHNCNVYCFCNGFLFGILMLRRSYRKIKQNHNCNMLDFQTSKTSEIRLCSTKNVESSMCGA